MCSGSQTASDWIYRLICLAILVQPAAAQRSIPDSANAASGAVFLDGEPESYTVTELIEELLFNPLNINIVSEDELNLLPGADPMTCRQIIRYRENFGNFYSAADLYNIRGIDSNCIKSMLLFIKFPRSNTTFPKSNTSKTELKIKSSFRDAQTSGIPSNTIESGSFTNRLQARYAEFSMDLSLTKSTRSAGLYKTIPFTVTYRDGDGSMAAAGFFNLSLGLGLLSGSRGVTGTSQFFSRSPLNFGMGITTLPSATSATSLRGIGIILKNKWLRYGAAISQRRIPYRIDPLAPDGLTLLKTISYTPSSSSRTLTETSAWLFTGFHLAQNISTVFQYRHCGYSKADTIPPGKGKAPGAWSISAAYLRDKLFAGIELAGSGYGKAYLAKIYTGNSAGEYFSTTLRYLQSGFSAFRSGIFTQYHSVSGNEAGITFQFEEHFMQMRLNLYSDLFFTPASDGMLPTKKKGFESKIITTYSMGENAVAGMEVRYREREQPAEPDLYEYETENRFYYGGLRYEIRPGGKTVLLTKAGLKGVNDRSKWSSGIMLEQGVRTEILEHVQAGINLAFFRTPGSMISFYPSSTLLAGSITTSSLYEDGVSWTAWVQYMPYTGNRISAYLSSYRTADVFPESTRPAAGKTRFGIQAEITL